MAKYKFEIKPRDQRLMMDMEFLGNQLLRDTNKLSYVIRRFSDDSFLSFLAQFGISTGEQGAVGVESGTVAESLIRWRVFDNTMKATKIMAGPALPATIKANKSFVLPIDENWVGPAGLYMTEDMKSVFYVHKRGDGVGPTYNYEMAFVSGDPNETFTRKDLLAPGRYLNYIGNARPELSNESQPIKFDSGGFDMFNVTQVLRHSVAASGHALSTMIYMNAYDGNNVFDPANSGYLPFNADAMLRFHLRSVATTLYYGRTNFDAVNRRVLTIDSSSARPEVPMTAGALQQFQWTEKQIEYNPLDSAVNNKNLFEGAIAQQSEWFRDKGTMFLAITGNGGSAVIDGIKELKHTSQVQIQQQVPANGVITQVGLNYENAKYWTPNGVFTVMNTAYMTRPRGFMAEKVNYKGAPYDKDGFDIYFIPIKKMDDGRRTIRLATKSANGVNRGLVVGSIVGMSGMYNGGSLDLNQVGGKEFAANVSGQGERYKVASPVDGETFLALSEICVIVEDPDSILWMRAKFPNQPN